MTTLKEMDKLELIFVKERDTKRTTVFQEQLGDTELSDKSVAVGPLYIQQQALQLIGSPTKIKVTIEPAD